MRRSCPICGHAVQVNHYHEEGYGGTLAYTYWLECTVCRWTDDLTDDEYEEMARDDAD